jgi:hypothetical protein
MPQLIASVEGIEIRKVDLSKSSSTLGRRNDNDIVFDNLAVSGRHCVFEREGDEAFYVQDLSSTNGTFVNNQRVRRHRLKEGDVVAVADIELAFVATRAGRESRETTIAPLRAAESSEAAPPATNLWASFHFLSGPSAGRQVPIHKSVTTFGTPGIGVVVVSMRRTGCFVACMDASTTRPLLNGVAMAYDAAPLADGDVVEVAGSVMRFRAGGNA